MLSCSKLSIGVLGVAAAGFVHAQEVPPGVVLFDAKKATFKSATPTGNPRADIIGDDAKPGPYVFIARPRPTGTQSAAAKPHTHPDDRTYTII